MDMGKPNGHNEINFISNRKGILNQRYTSSDIRATKDHIELQTHNERNKMITKLIKSTNSKNIEK